MSSPRSFQTFKKKNDHENSSFCSNDINISFNKREIYADLFRAIYAIFESLVAYRATSNSRKISSRFMHDILETRARQIFLRFLLFQHSLVHSIIFG